MLDNMLPVVGPLLHRRYREERRAWMAEIGFPWPERRSRKRRPYPGAIDAEDPENG